MKTIHRALTCVLGLSVLALAWPAVAADAPFPGGSDVEPAWRVNAYVQNQTGVFISPDKAAFDKNGSPTNHGGMLGKLSMCRFTLGLDADWRPHQRVWTHVSVRLARSLALTADDNAQVPKEGYYGAGLGKKRREWVRDTYYNETEIREFFVNFRAAPWLDLRLGRQVVAWGESGNARLLDLVNPTNSTWHFGGFESFEDQRMPLWMVRVMADIPALRGGLDLVWVPMLPLFESAEDTVTVPLTFVGAWGLPTPPKQRDDSVGPDKINSKPMLIPHDFGTDSRVGFRWKGQAGKSVTYSLVYWYGHQVTPPIPQYLQRPMAFSQERQQWEVERATYDVFLGFPRQHVVGLSLEGQVPFPLGTMLKLEAALEPERTFAMYSAAAQGAVQTIEKDGERWEKTPFQQRKHLVFNYLVTLQQPFWIRPVNREEPFILVFQFQHQVIPGLDELNKDNAILEVPGYDTTVMSKHQFRIIGALFTSFLKGTITPRIAAGWIPKTTHWTVKKTGDIEVWNLKKQSASNGSGFATFSLGLKLGDSLRAILAYNRFFGNEPYDQVGFYRDRDEVNLTVRYQF